MDDKYRKAATGLGAYAIGLMTFAEFNTWLRSFVIVIAILLLIWGGTDGR